MRFFILLIVISAFLLFPSTAHAPVLVPGETGFRTETILIQPIGGNFLSLQGDSSYLNIYWNATFLGVTKPAINAKCYFNCNISTSPCSGSQTCSYSGPTGIGVCTITNPNYNQPLSIPDLVSCNFTDPQNPSVEYKLPDGNYPSRSFVPIDFQVITSPSATTVGIPVSVPVTLKNTGLFTGSFDLTLYSISTPVVINPHSVSNPNYIVVGPLSGDSYLATSEAVSFPVDITVLSALTRVRVGVLANSTLQPQIYKESIIDINTGFASLSEFHLEGVVQIILFSTILLFIAFSRKKLFK